MRKTLFLALALLFAGVRLAAQPQDEGRFPDKTTASQKSDSESDRLIETAFQSAQKLATQLSATDRIELLLRMADAAGKWRPQKAKQWSREALRLAGQMRPGGQRSMYEAEAVMHLSAADSEQALALLLSLEAPASAGGFDPQTAAAPSVFERFLDQHPDGWETLAAKAQSMGDAGRYPFKAIHSVINRIEPSNEDAAGELMQHAVRYYHRSARPSSADPMADLLAAHSKFVRGSALKAILAEVVSDLLKAQTGPGADWPSHSGSRGLNEFTLAQLMPIIQSVDPAFEAKLRRDHPISDLILRLEAHDEPSTATPVAGQSVAVNLELSGRSIAVTYDAAEHSPEGVAVPSEALSEDGTALQLVERPSTEDETGILSQSDEALKNADNPEQRLRILVGRGTAMIPSGRWNEFSQVLADALALGEGLFRKSVDEDPQANWIGRPGASELSMLVTEAAQGAPHLLLERIRNMRISSLQAELYISLVEGLQGTRSAPMVMVIRSARVESSPR